MKTIVLTLAAVLTFTTAVQAYSVKQPSTWGRIGERMGQGIAEQIRRDQDWRAEQQRLDIMREQVRIQERMRFQQEMQAYGR